MPIIRDRNGIIMQHPLDKNSGGDSASRVGMMALCDSLVDQNCLLKFEKPKGSGLLTRHPDFYSTDCFTRDQLICFVGGLWRRNDKEAKSLARRIFWSHLKRGFFCQNQLTQFERNDKGFFGRDPLGPQHIGHLIIGADLWWLNWFLFLSYPILIIDIIYATKVNPRIEQNQIISMCFTHGLLWLWVFLHPNWQGSIKTYFNGWRDQPEIAQELIFTIEEELLKNED